MNIYAVSRMVIENAKPPTIPYSIISINGKTEKPAKLPINDKCLGSLVLHFDDIQKEYDYLRYQLFTKEQANQILDFILSLKKEHGNHLCLVHCNAGISRSQAVGAALSHIFNNECTKFFQEGIPNMFVYNTILKEYYEMITE